MIPTPMLLEHMLEFLLEYQPLPEFPGELARAIPLELLPLLVLAHLLDLLDLEHTLHGGTPLVLAG